MKRNVRFEKFTRLLNSCKYNATNLASIVHRSKPTMLKRMRNPGEFTLNDVVNILRDGKIEPEDMIEALRRDLK